MAASDASDDKQFEASRVEFGSRVRAARHAQGKSLETLAEGSALHWAFVSKVERGQTNITLRTLLRLSTALEVDPSVLVRGLNEHWRKSD